MAIAACAVALCLVLAIWVADRVTWQGERVLYGVECVAGQWQDLACTGRLQPGDRYAFRASPRRHEVITWTIGSSLPSQTYVGCAVTNRDRWTCPMPNAERSAATLVMAKGRTHCSAGTTDSIHILSKWKWYLLHTGLGLFSHAQATVQTRCETTRPTRAS